MHNPSPERETKGITVGKGDRRNSNKMLRRRSRARYKDRMSRPRELARQPVAERKAAEEAAKPADSSEEGEDTSES